MKTIVFIFRKLSVPLKIQRAREIVLRLTGNVNFPTVNPTLAVIIAAINSLETAWEAAADGGHILRAKMKAREQELVDIMLLLASYITNASGGDEQKIISAGFDVKKPTSHAKRKAAIIIGNIIGQLKLIAETPSTRANVGYEWQYCKDPMPADSSETSNNWIPAEFTVTASVTLSRLPLKEKLWFRVRTILPKQEKGPWVILGSAFLTE